MDESIVRPGERERTLVFLVSNVYEPHIGGITSYVANLEKAIRDRFRTKVLSYPPLLVEFEGRHPRTKVRWLFHAAFAAAVFGVVLGHRLLARRVIVHSHSAAFCMVPGVFARAAGAGAIHTIHSPVTKRSRLLEWLTPRLDALVFVSPALRDAYRDMTGARNPREFIFPGAVEIPPARAAEVRQRVRADVARTWKISEDVPLVLYAGRVVEDKGVDVLARAASRLVLEDGCVLVAGPPGSTEQDLAYFRRLTDLAEPAGRAGRFRVLGRVTRDQLEDLYAASDVVVVPSRWSEPAPMAAVEAMAHGSALVVSRTGGLPYLVSEGQAGLLVPPGDDGALADAIRALVRDPALRERLSTEARRLAERRHSLHAFGDEHDRVYRMVLDRPGHD